MPTETQFSSIQSRFRAGAIVRPADRFHDALDDAADALDGLVDVNVSVPTTVESVSIDPVSTVTDYAQENPGKTAGIVAVALGVLYAFVQFVMPGKGK